MRTTALRERVLALVREERAAQIERYGTNDRNLLGFGSTLSAYPWLLPYSDANSSNIEAAFRHDYEQYVETHGEPTWMHLIREEVAELFNAKTRDSLIEEAVQVAALCVSLVERVYRSEEGPVS